MVFVIVIEFVFVEVGNIGFIGGVRMKCDGIDFFYGDWCDDFVCDGYVVVKGVIF